MIETKVAVGSFTGILTGLITWALVAYVPAFRSGLPAPVAALIPVAAAWLAHSVAGYLAPHTPRPAAKVPAAGLDEQLMGHRFDQPPPSGTVTVVQPGASAITPAGPLS